MTEPFPDPREAALALLTECPDLSHSEAGFLGHMCVAACPSDKQIAWLVKLLAKHSLPALAGGGEHG